jgi:hypothetical protein
MNLSTLILPLLILLLPLKGLGQDFKEGRIVYAITFPELDMDEATRGTLPTESVVFVKGHLSRTDINVGPRMSSASIYNAQTGEVTALTEFMDSKSYIIMKPGAGPVPTKEGSKVLIMDKEQKQIAGYSCSRAVVKTEGNVSSDLYFTKEIKARLPVNVQFPGADGFPMEYMVNQNGLKMLYTVKQVIPESVPSSLFSVPSDYKLVTPQDLMQIYKEAEEQGKDGQVRDFELPKK